MLKEGVEHERADTGGRIHAHQVRSENIRQQVRFGQKLRIGLTRFQQFINKVRRLALSPFGPVLFHYPFV